MDLYIYIFNNVTNLRHWEEREKIPLYEEYMLLILFSDYYFINEVKLNTDCK